jgi:hypothetical protein
VESEFEKIDDSCGCPAEVPYIHIVVWRHVYGDDSDMKGTMME